MNDSTPFVSIKQGSCVYLKAFSKVVLDILM